MDLTEIGRQYRENGFVSGLEILSEAEARRHRDALEKAEAAFGKLHYKAKIHTVLRSPLELATHPRILDVVEALIGPDILLYDVEYIIKEPHAPSHVSWHQDLTYWGFSDDAQVSLWLALSPASAESGCMRMIPGSHRRGRHDHVTTQDSSNVLLQGQTVMNVREEEAVLCPLAPGQASFHHGWTLHASTPNRSADRRIGLNAQFIAPHMRQTKHDRDSALLVRGEDRFNHFRKDRAARADFEPVALQRWGELDKLHLETQGNG
ncbi:phytanoyl-CoA dioxygenase PhyH [Dongia mobilis]|uniref:Phytanoyl-CoA dioxygenase PhyH n=1 Tax=Dongia mobilis TaxID=578943 RepID=A0A4R6WSG3_9PROT|nr:phytanoyl-CoA dioxygenase family protein [Dongia mobilis]TDQ84456.1 phytanoyl-CoA dioxygenase PhyH [Dongia mobilis]